MVDETEEKREAVGADDFISGFISCPVGKTAKYTIAKIEKITPAKDSEITPLAQKNFYYELITDRGQKKTVNSWSEWNALKEFLKGLVPNEEDLTKALPVTLEENHVSNKQYMFRKAEA